MTVPPPPAVPSELMRRAAEALRASLVSGARRDALTEAIEAIEAARIEHTEGIGNPTGAIYRTAMDRAARIVTDLRDATDRSAP